MDCMDGMKTFPDKYFDLAIVDPPYGGGQHFNFRFGIDDQVYENRKPDKDYWEQLFRVSQNQIVWGGNYFTNNLPENRCWISWYKGNPLNSFSDFELAWTSFDEVCKSVKLVSYGFNHADKRHSGQSTIHPTQKPIALYKWILKNYAKPDFKILDTHVGSASSIIAFLDYGCEWIGFEIDEDYHKAASERIEIHKKRPKPFFTDVELADKNIKQKGFFDDNKP